MTGIHSGHYSRFSKIVPLLAAVLAAVGCSSTEVLPTLVPSPTPSQPFPVLEITASLEPVEVRAGELFIITTDAGDAGIPQYTLSLGEQLIAITRYDGTLVSSTPSARFEVVSWTAEASGASWTVRALEVGEFEARVFVSGEVGITPAGPFSFTSDSESLQLTVLSAD